MLCVHLGSKSTVPDMDTESSMNACTLQAQEDCKATDVIRGELGFRMLYIVWKEEYLSEAHCGLGFKQSTHLLLSRSSRFISSWRVFLAKDWSMMLVRDGVCTVIYSPFRNAVKDAGSRATD